MTTTIVVERAHGLAIEGVPRAAAAIQATSGLRAFVATASIQPYRAEGATYPGRQVRATMGTPSDQRVEFGGEIDDDALKLWPNDQAIQCSGYLGRTQRATGHQDTTAPETSDSTVLDELGNVVLYPQYYAASKTDQQIVVDLLALCGVTDVDIQGSGQLFGVVEPVILGFGEAPWRLISDLDRLTHYRTFDDPAGVVRRVPWLLSPSTTTAFDFSEGVEILEADRARSRRPVRNRVVLTGLDQLGTTSIPFTPTGVAQAASPLDPDTGAPVIASPPTYQTETWSTPLAETQEICQAYCEGRLGEVNRVEERLTIAVGGGQVGVRPGMTVGVTSPHLDYDGRWAFFVEQVRQESGAGWLRTVLDLLALVKSQGVNPNQRPVAVIALSALSETLADGSTLTIVQADGSASYDPDGEIVSYLWSGSTAPVAVGVAGATAVYVYAGDIAGETITLTVLDNFGLSGSTTRILSPSSAPIVVRDLISAETTRLQASRDGEKTWVDILDAGNPIAAIGVCEIGADAYTHAWSATQLFKVNEDNGAALVPEVANPRAAWITESLNGGKPKDRVWVATSGGQVWFSQAAGDPGTFVRLADLPGSGACNAIQESAFRDGDVYALRGNVLYHSFDRAASWQALRTHPNAALVGSRIASGFGKLFAAFGGGADADAGVARVVERQNVAIGDFPAPARPVNVTGLTYAIYKDVLYAVDIDAAGTAGRAWLADVSTSSFNWVARGPYNTGTLGLPRHSIRDGAIEVVYGAADKAIWKAFGDLGVFYVLKTLTSPVAGKMIGYGRARAQPVAPSELIASCWYYGAARTGITGSTLDTGPHKILKRSAAGAWSVLSDHPFAGSFGGGGFLDNSTDRVARPLLRVAGTDTYLTWAIATHPGDWQIGSGHANCFRSTDGCLTWTPIAGANTDSVVWMDQAIDGALYAVAHGGTAIIKSVDGGATWSTVHSGGDPAAQSGKYTGISCDPLNAARGAVCSGAGGRITTDGFATLSALEEGAVGMFATGGNPSVVRAPSGGATIWRLDHGATAPAEGLARCPDGGARATASGVPGVPSATVGRRFGGSLYQNLGLSGLLRSIDDGASWSIFFGSAQHPTTPGTTGNFIAGDVAHGADGTIIVGLADGAPTGPGGGMALVAFAALPPGETAWVDLTGNMVAQVGGFYLCSPGGLSLA